MTHWWPNAFPSQPWRTWFWAMRPGDDGTGNSFTEWPTGYYWFYKIPPEVGHQEQLAFKSPTRRVSVSWGPMVVEAETVYILCEMTDTPNWGNVNGLMKIAPPCGNWYSALFKTIEVERSQTSGLMAAVNGERDQESSIIAAIAKTDSLECTTKAAIQGNPSQDVVIFAAIAGDVTKTFRIKAAIRKEQSLEITTAAAIAKTDSLECTTKAAIQGNPSKHCHLKAAVKGEAHLESGIIANVVKRRVETILLEMENLFPQECDLRSTPNWRSRVKDYRKDPIG